MKDSGCLVVESNSDYQKHCVGSPILEMYLVSILVWRVHLKTGILTISKNLVIIKF